MFFACNYLRFGLNLKMMRNCSKNRRGLDNAPSSQRHSILSFCLKSQNDCRNCICVRIVPSSRNIHNLSIVCYRLLNQKQIFHNLVLPFYVKHNSPIENALSEVLICAVFVSVIEHKRLDSCGAFSIQLLNNRATQTCRVTIHHFWLPLFKHSLCDFYLL